MGTTSAAPGPVSDRAETAFDIANRFRDSPPVDLEGMARALGIEVFPRAELSDGVSGRLSRRIDASGRTSFSIDVNGRHSEARRRFTLAHEIAHYLLHRDLMRDGIVDNAMYRSGLPAPVETEANRLAAELLMPPNLIRTFWRAGIQSLSQLCTAFGVSEEAMRIRLKQLGYGA